MRPVLGGSIGVHIMGSLPGATPCGMDRGRRPSRGLPENNAGRRETEQTKSQEVSYPLKTDAEPRIREPRLLAEGRRTIIRGFPTMSRHDDGWKGGPSDPEESTRRLFWRARDGDEDARDRLFRKLLPRIKRWAHGRLPRGARGMEDTEDIAGEVVVKTLEAMDYFEPQRGESLGAWLRQTILNKIRDEARRLAR